MRIMILESSFFAFGYCMGTIPCCILFMQLYSYCFYNWLECSFIFLQSNQQRAHSNHWRGKLYCGLVTDIGYAPILLCIIVFLSILFINSVVAGTFKIAFQLAISFIQCIHITLEYLYEYYFPLIFASS
jgi:hypothetical protein